MVSKLAADALVMFIRMVWGLAMLYAGMTLLGVL
jgi:hypothetical protein